jgi:uncharacterized membrane protein YeaQ/YmgE (transglycosylase-associated protein family)
MSSGTDYLELRPIPGRLISVFCIGRCSTGRMKELGAVCVGRERCAAREARSMIVNILLWALFGLVAWIVGKSLIGGAERTNPAGILLTIVLGIAGAVVGGFLSSNLGWNLDALSVAGFAVAVGGAVLLLLLYGLFQSARKPH